MAKGIFTEYLNKKFDPNQLTDERKKQLKEISQIRGRDIFVYAADVQKGDMPITIAYSDLVPILDQMQFLKGNALDVILETPGGSGEAAEDIINIFRDKYDDVSFIIPGMAKSAGTIMAMSGDEILMEPSSALGPIDAQINFRGQTVSAHAFIEGIESVKREVIQNGGLNQAYFPMLQNLTPGNIEAAKNAMNFSEELVADWLMRYKFKNWTTHSSTGQPVTREEKKKRAIEISKQLSNHGHWNTHGRSIRIKNLEEMRVKVTNYRDNSKLYKAIRRYFILLGMSFEQQKIFKVFETPESQIMRLDVKKLLQPTPAVNKGVGEADVECGNCKTKSKIQVNLGEPSPLKPGMMKYPSNDIFECPSCKTPNDISSMRDKLENQLGGKLVLDYT